MRGVEPPRLSAQPPQGCVYTISPHPHYIHVAFLNLNVSFTACIPLPAGRQDFTTSAIVTYVKAAELGFEPRVALIQSQACYHYTTRQYSLFQYNVNLLNKASRVTPVLLRSRDLLAVIARFTRKLPVKHYTTRQSSSARNAIHHSAI